MIRRVLDDPLVVVAAVSLFVLWCMGQALAGEPGSPSESLPPAVYRVVEFEGGGIMPAPAVLSGVAGAAWSVPPTPPAEGRPGHDRRGWGRAVTGGWPKSDVLFVAVVAVIFLFGVAVPAVRQHRDREIFDPPSGAQRRWRRPPDS